MSDTAKSDSDYALIAHTEGQQPVLLRYLMLILNCRFGCHMYLLRSASTPIRTKTPVWTNLPDGPYA